MTEEYNPIFEIETSLMAAVEAEARRQHTALRLADWREVNPEPASKNAAAIPYNNVAEYMAHRAAIKTYQKILAPKVRELNQAAKLANRAVNEAVAKLDLQAGEGVYLRVPYRDAGRTVIAKFEAIETNDRRVIGMLRVVDWGVGPVG